MFSLEIVIVAIIDISELFCDISTKIISISQKKGEFYIFHNLDEHMISLNSPSDFIRIGC